MKFDLISVICRLHGLSTVFRNFLKNVKTLEPKTYITFLRTPYVISERNIEGSIFPTLCRPSRGDKGEWLLMLLEFDAQRSDLSHLIVAVISKYASSTVVKFLKLIQ